MGGSIVFTEAKCATGTPSIGSAVRRSAWTRTKASSSGSSGMAAMLPSAAVTARAATGTVVVTRGGVRESTHAVHAAVADRAGRLLAFAGDPDRLTTLRSTAKPLQAAPMVDGGAADAFGFDDPVIAVTCASHAGLDVHVDAVRRGLALAGVPAERVETCAGGVEERLRHNCSGNHLALLAAASHAGAGLDGYREAGHPVQRAALDAVARAARLAPEAVATCVDGCGTVAFALPLATLAAVYARLPEEHPRQARAMQAHPELVGGPGTIDTDLMRALPGVVAKTGAEGLQCVSLPEGRGLAVRCEDGAARAAGPAAVEVLAALLGWSLTPGPLRAHREPPAVNAHGDVVGTVTAAVSLVATSASGL
jgi:L-asparaginase